MIKYAAVYAFLLKWYKHSRFEERNSWGQDWKGYSQSVAQRYFDTLQKEGKAVITWHESCTNQEICFDSDLNITNTDAPPREKADWSGKANLSQIF